MTELSTAIDLRPAPGPLTATFEPCPPPEHLAADWQALALRAEASPFLAWPWVGTLMASGRPAWLARLHDGARLAGLALLGRRPGRLGDWWRRPSLHLTESGDDAIDSVMIEYNGVLAESGRAAEVRSALLAALQGRGAPKWRELHLAGVGEDWPAACREAGLGVRLLRPPQPAPLADLAAIAGDPLDALSRNSRQQLRRSLRHYQQRGAVALRRAGDTAEALAWLDRLEELHTASWRARGKPGAFAHPQFKDFHRRLITAQPGFVDLLCLSVGGEALGYLYNLRWRNLACAYQSGLAYEQDAQGRPGLVAHLLAMRRYREEGVATYSFLAGDGRYKSSLASGEDRLLWLAAYRHDLPHRLEHWLRAALGKSTGL